MPRLTDFKIRAAKPAPRDFLLTDGGNLFLRVRPTAKTWVVRIKRQGRRRVYTLGNYPNVGLLEARKQAAHLVAVERGEARASVGDTIESYMAGIIRPRYKRTASAEVYARRLTARLGSVAIDAVRAVDVARVVSDKQRTAPVSAMRMLAFAKGFFAWAVGIGLVERSPIADVQARAFGVKEESRERTLTDDEIRAFWWAPDLPHRALLRFLLLTGLRIGEAQAARVEWIHADGWLHLPADVMKNAKPHQAFLSPLARQQIEGDAAPVLFRAVSPTAVQSALHRWQDRHGVESRWTPHDLRRSFASRMGDAKVAPHVIAKALSHTFAPTPSLAVYLRSEWVAERQAAGVLLAKVVARIVAAKTRSGTARIAR
jgi:integrase